jgi:hypothetical protein
VAKVLDTSITNAFKYIYIPPIGAANVVATPTAQAAANISLYLQVLPPASFIRSTVPINLDNSAAMMLEM